MSKAYRRVVHWFRRDLRLTDNTSLLASVSSSDEVVPVYVRSGWEGAHLWTGAKRQKFLCECLTSLSSNLEHLGGQLIIRQGDAVSEILKLVERCKGLTLFSSTRTSIPFGQAVEAELKKKSSDSGSLVSGCDPSWSY